MALPGYWMSVGLARALGMSAGITLWLYEPRQYLAGGYGMRG